MKKILVTLFLLLSLISSVFAQKNDKTDNTQFIEVTCNGEVEYIPDFIKYTITIADDSNDTYPTDLDDRSDWKIREFQALLKKRQEQRYLKVWEIFKAEGINDNALVKDDNSLDFNYRIETEYENRTFTVKFDNYNLFQQVLPKLKAANICSGQITEVYTAHLKTLEEKAQVIAFNNAKIRAEKLAAAAQAKIGKALQIKESYSLIGDAPGELYPNGWIAYPPLRQDSPDAVSMKNAVINNQGKFVLKQALTVRFSLEN